MYMLMRYNKVPELARRKIGNSLVTSMISGYMKKMASSSSHRHNFEFANVLCVPVLCSSCEFVFVERPRALAGNADF